MSINMNDLKVFLDKIKNQQIISYNEMPNSPNQLMLSKWYSKEIEWIHNQINVLENENNFKNVCQKGCNGCCKHSVPITYLEASVIQQELSGLDKTIRNSLLDKTERACKILQENNLADLQPMYMYKNQKILKEKYFNLDIYCPLSDEKGECMIYPVRPIACCTYRAYNSKDDCSMSFNVTTALTFDSFDFYLLNRVSKVKKPKPWSKFIPLALRDILLNRL